MSNPLESIRMLVSIGLGCGQFYQKTLLNQDTQKHDLNVEMNRQLGIEFGILHVLNLEPCRS